MADDAALPAAAATGDSPVPAGDPTAEGKKVDKRKRSSDGLVSRVFKGIFGGREDLEKRLEHLSKEEATIHARVKRRARSSHHWARNVVALAVSLEVFAVVYAVMATRSSELSWQMRAVRVLPMFALPALAAAIYSALMSFSRMLDNKDQKALERLRAERQAKIDDLKEKTNYYLTQQLIQRYDPDPAAKAAAATVLASKLGADSGLKVYVGDETNVDSSSGKSSDVQPGHPDGLRHRKPVHMNSAGGPVSQLADEYTNEYGDGTEEAGNQNQRIVGHYTGPVHSDGGWLARLAALLVGEDPTQCYALICGNCHMHNGLARKEDFPYVTYYCPHCHALNGPRQPEEHEMISTPPQIDVSQLQSPTAPTDENDTTENPVVNALAPVQEPPAEKGDAVKELPAEKGPAVNAN